MPALFLRLAALLALLQFAAHTTLVLTASPSHGPQEVALVESMKSLHFTFGGASRSYWDFYFGYALMAAFTCLIESALFWQLGTLAKTAAARLRPVIATLGLANIGFAMLVATYFFYLPVLFDLAIAACLALALVATFSRNTWPIGWRHRRPVTGSSA